MKWIEWVILAIGLILFFPQIGIFGPYFTIVKEGTAKVVLRFGGYLKVLLCWKDHDVDKDGMVIDVPGKKSWGLKYVGLRHIDTFLRYRFRWKDIQLVEGEEKEQFHEVERDWILVRPDVYIITIKAAETKVPERIPINAQFAYTLRIGNVRKATLDAPPNWFENATVRLNSAHRTFIASHYFDELLLLKEKKVHIEKEEIDKDLIEDVMEKSWGIVTEGIELRDITLPIIYQEAAAAERRAKMEAAGRAEEILGTVIAAVVRATGLKENEIQVEFQRDPEAFYRKHKPIIDNAMTKLSMEERVYLRIETPGATGMEGALLRLIGALKRVPMGKEEAPKSEKREERAEEKERERELSEKEKKVLGVFREKRPMEKLHQLKKKKKERKKKWGF